MLNQSQVLSEGQEAPDALPTSTSGRVERNAQHFRTGSSGEAELYERVGSSRGSYTGSPEVVSVHQRNRNPHYINSMHACMRLG